MSFFCFYNCITISLFSPFTVCFLFLPIATCLLCFYFPFGLFLKSCYIFLVPPLSLLLSLSFSSFLCLLPLKICILFLLISMSLLYFSFPFSLFIKSCYIFPVFSSSSLSLLLFTPFSFSFLFSILFLHSSFFYIFLSTFSPISFFSTFLLFSPLSFLQRRHYFYSLSLFYFFISYTSFWLHFTPAFIYFSSLLPLDFFLSISLLVGSFLFSLNHSPSLVLPAFYTRFFFFFNLLFSS